MARSGDRFDMPDGSAYVVERSAAEAGGASVEMEFFLPPGCVPPPPHVHPQQVEEYEVLQEDFDVMVDGEWRTLAPGESASVPRGALHTFRNRVRRGCACPQLAQAGGPLRELHRTHARDAADRRGEEQARSPPIRLPLHGDVGVRRHAGARPEARTAPPQGPRRPRAAPATPHLFLVVGQFLRVGDLAG